MQKLNPHSSCFSFFIAFLASSHWLLIFNKAKEYFLLHTEHFIWFLFSFLCTLFQLFTFVLLHHSSTTQHVFLNVPTLSAFTISAALSLQIPFALPWASYCSQHSWLLSRTSGYGWPCLNRWLPLVADVTLHSDLIQQKQCSVCLHLPLLLGCQKNAANIFFFFKVKNWKWCFSPANLSLNVMHASKNPRMFWWDFWRCFW